MNLLVAKQLISLISSASLLLQTIAPFTYITDFVSPAKVSAGVCNPGEWYQAGGKPCGGPCGATDSGQCKGDGSGWDCKPNPGQCSGGYEQVAPPPDGGSIAGQSGANDWNSCKRDGKTDAECRQRADSNYHKVAKEVSPTDPQATADLAGDQSRQTALTEVKVTSEKGASSSLSAEQVKAINEGANKAIGAVQEQKLSVKTDQAEIERIASAIGRESVATVKERKKECNTETNTLWETVVLETPIKTEIAKEPVDTGNACPAPPPKPEDIVESDPGRPADRGLREDAGDVETSEEAEVFKGAEYSCRDNRIYFKPGRNFPEEVVLTCDSGEGCVGNATAGFKCQPKAGGGSVASKSYICTQTATSVAVSGECRYCSYAGQTNPPFCPKLVAATTVICTSTGQQVRVNGECRVCQRAGEVNPSAKCPAAPTTTRAPSIQEQIVTGGGQVQPAPAAQPAPSATTTYRVGDVTGKSVEDAAFNAVCARGEPKFDSNDGQRCFLCDSKNPPAYHQVDCPAPTRTVTYPGRGTTQEIQSRGAAVWEASRARYPGVGEPTSTPMQENIAARQEITGGTATTGYRGRGTTQEIQSRGAAVWEYIKSRFPGVGEPEPVEIDYTKREYGKVPSISGPGTTVYPGRGTTQEIQERGRAIWEVTGSRYPGVGQDGVTSDHNVPLPDGLRNSTREPDSEPEVVAASPAVTPGGQAVFTGFFGGGAQAGQVLIDKISALVRSWSPTRIVADLPPGTVRPFGGSANVEITTADGKKAETTVEVKDKPEVPGYVSAIGKDKDGNPVPGKVHFVGGRPGEETSASGTAVGRDFTTGESYTVIFEPKDEKYEAQGKKCTGVSVPGTAEGICEFVFEEPGAEEPARRYGGREVEDVSVPRPSLPSVSVPPVRVELGPGPDTTTDVLVDVNVVDNPGFLRRLAESAAGAVPPLWAAQTAADVLRGRPQPVSVYIDGIWYGNIDVNGDDQYTIPSGEHTIKLVQGGRVVGSKTVDVGKPYIPGVPFARQTRTHVDFNIAERSNVYGQISSSSPSRQPGLIKPVHAQDAAVDAVVTLVASTGESYTAVSDDQGRFILNVPGDDVYTINVAAPGKKSVVVKKVLSASKEYAIDVQMEDGDTGEEGGTAEIIAVASKIELVEGWNAVSPAMVPNYINTAQELLTEIARQGGYATTVARWNGGRWEQFVQRATTTWGQDFALSAAEGYFIRVHLPAEVIFPGDEPQTPVTYALSKGYNFVGVLSDTPYTAEGIIDKINQTGADTARTITGFEEGLYEPFVKQDDTAYGEDFLIRELKAYFIRVNRDTVWSP